ncbi:MAG: hypothetical protein DWQ45_00320 [Planctomycetota bacterium]|nr:MAG: hypothetical protein DWQ41_21725 [Planctomycetota bacterium]REK40035.1 MAG: hypothetical protein DWQ45_00320 [Planctomycetota bacterium]
MLSLPLDWFILLFHDCFVKVVDLRERVDDGDGCGVARCLLQLPLAGAGEGQGRETDTDAAMMTGLTDELWDLMWTYGEVIEQGGQDELGWKMDRLLAAMKART